MAAQNNSNQKRYVTEKDLPKWTLSTVFIVSFFLFALLVATLPLVPSVTAPPTDLQIFAEAASFARLDPVDPSGWFYQAVLYNPTSSNINVTGLRWWYNSTANFMGGSRDATCYDKRYFSTSPTTWSPDNKEIRWEYAADTISPPIIVPGKKMILTWIEVPTLSINNDVVVATYYVQAYSGNQWKSSQLYVSHTGHDNDATTVFRADFNLATNPDSENQTLQAHLAKNVEWLYNENRNVVAGVSTKVRLIPVTSSRNSLGINNAMVNVTFPSNWSYVNGSAFNMYGENITRYSVAGRDRLRWDLNHDVLKYAVNQSMAQNFIEFNVIAPSLPGTYNFTVTSRITSLNARTAVENQSIYVVVQTRPVSNFTFTPAVPQINQSVFFNASASNDIDGNITNYSWNFGDRQTSTGTFVNHSFAVFGNYTVTLTVTDNDGLNGTKSSIVRVTEAPTAYFTIAPSSPRVGENVTLDASSSVPNGGSITNYLLDFGDNQTGAGMTVIHAYTSTGNFTVVLNVTDSEGLSGITNKTIVVISTPFAAFSYSPILPLANQTVNFDASLSSPRVAQSLTTCGISVTVNQDLVRL